MANRPSIPRDAAAKANRRQKGRCLYCGCHFGDWVDRNGTPQLVEPQAEHFVPYAYAQNTLGSTNIVLACKPCNMIKGSRMFDAVGDAREHILKRRRLKGYSDKSKDAAQVDRGFEHRRLREELEQRVREGPQLFAKWVDPEQSE